MKLKEFGPREGRRIPRAPRSANGWAPLLRDTLDPPQDVTPSGLKFFLPRATKLGQGNIFRSVCQEFCRGGVRSGWWGRAWQGACIAGVMSGREHVCGRGHAWWGVGVCMAVGGHAW